METQIFHGDLTVDEISNALIARFNRGNLRSQKFGSNKKAVIQITSLKQPVSGGQTTITISLEQVEDGIAVQIGNQSWLGVVASLGTTALVAWKNPWNLLWRLDDVAQDVENLQLADRVWEVVEEAARMAGATYELSERLRRLACSYCGTANPVGEPSCIACGAPLGKDQPETCNNCGFVVKKEENLCPNCGERL